MNGLCNMLHGCRVSRLFLKRDQCMCVFMCVCAVLFGFYFSSGYEAYAATSARCWNENALFSSDAIQHIAALIPLSSRDTRRNAGPLLSVMVSYVKKRCFLYSETVRNCEVLLICSYIPTKFT